MDNNGIIVVLSEKSIRSGPGGSGGTLSAECKGGSPCVGECHDCADCNCVDGDCCSD